MRIQKYLSQQKVCSRREAEEYIKEGRITVNGKVVTVMGVQIDPSVDVVKLLDGTHGATDEKITIAVNKPRGIVCSRAKNEGKTIFELLPEFEKLNVVGRLDKESEGLLLMSNDGVVTSAVTGEDHKVEKEYTVRVREEISGLSQRRMEQGIQLEDGLTLPATVTIQSGHRFTIVLREGRKHQIRRMADAVRLTITDLARVRIGNIKLGRLKPGEYRKVTPKELVRLKNRPAA